MRMADDMRRQAKAFERQMEKERMKIVSEYERRLEEREGSIRKLADETLHHVKSDAKREIRIARQAAQKESEQTVQRALAVTDIEPSGRGPGRHF